MKTHKRMKAWLDSGEGVVFPCVWIYDSNDPLVYHLWLPVVLGDVVSRNLEIEWLIGRDLVRTALSTGKIGGQKDILVIETQGTTTVYLSNGEKSALISMNTQDLRDFDRTAHKMVSAEEEMDLEMKKLDSLVL